MEAIVTRVGWADFGDYEHRGVRLYRDLGGKTSFLALVAFAVTGRQLSVEDSAVLDDIAVCLHVPEPRVWPLKLARLAATGGRFLHGLMAGCAAMDSEAIGISVVAAAGALLTDIARYRKTNDAPALQSWLDARGAMPGFGVYGRRVDERVDALETFLRSRGRSDQPFWSLVREVRPMVQSSRNMDIHAWGAVAAALLDLGFSPEEMPPLLAIMLQSSYVAHAVEGAKLQSPSLRRLPAEAIRYVGVGARQSPRALAAEESESSRDDAP